MEIKKINIEPFYDYIGTDAILFMRPIRCMTYRVPSVPETMQEHPHYDDIFDILNAGCSVKRGGIWFFAPPDYDSMLLALETFCLTYELPAFLMEPESFGRDDDGYLIPEMQN